MQEKEKLHWEQQTLSKAINLLCDDGNDYDTIIILGAEYLSEETKKF